MAQQTTTPNELLTHDRAREILQRSWDLINEHDLANVPKIFTEDIEFEDDAAPETIRGHDEMRRFLGGIWTAASPPRCA